MATRQSGSLVVMAVYIRTLYGPAYSLFAVGFPTNHYNNTISPLKVAIELTTSPHSATFQQLICL